MHTDTLLVILITIITGQFLFNTLLTYLNNRNRGASLPDSLKDIYEIQEYEKSQAYGKANAKLSMISSSLSFLITFTIIATRMFGSLDLWLGEYTDNPIWHALLFFGILGIASTIIDIPFSYYSTFVIEERYGFNRSTLKTFVTDLIKSLVVGGVIGGILLALIVKSYLVLGSHFFLIAFAIVAGFSLFMLLFYSSIIVPLFNKQTPLEDGELKNKIMGFAGQVDFPIKEIYVIDGSKRSAKANAYFTGLGKMKRIVLYDTLIDQLDSDEILAVLAHEVGHAKKRHVIQSMFLSLTQTFIIFYLLSLALEQPATSYVMGSDKPTFELGLLFFSFVLTPITEITSIVMSIFSRKNEYQADDFAKQHGLKEGLIGGLKKLTKNSLANLTPHPFVVKCSYSHPTLSQRIDHLNQNSAPSGLNSDSE
ncbi:M48 family metallopeptidase [Halosquirtibacter xylanolyticus]|uniref:M48 family metallopeptidase n=1 Tax=Halosquirtibacter xylanolyticus TaxID=3374599 RepID=UPI00374A8BF0|nr:M48 family metallopeptidase [Prolixibacteraceae bacterium]